MQRTNHEIALSADQIVYLEECNPSFRERHAERAAPGELQCQDTFFVGMLKGVSRVQLRAVIDTYGSFAFGFVHTTEHPEAAVAVMHNDVLPFYKEHDITVKAILTDNGREYCGTDASPYQLHLALNDIEHRRTQERLSQTNGFIERLSRTVLGEFFRVVFRQKLYENLESLQTDLDSWLHEYNYKRPHLGIGIRDGSPGKQ